MDVVTARLLHAGGNTFVLRSDDMCFYAEEDVIGPLWKGKRFPITACSSGWAMLSRVVAVIDDIYSKRRVRECAIQLQLGKVTVPPLVPTPLIHQHTAGRQMEGVTIAKDDFVFDASRPTIAEAS